MGQTLLDKVWSAHTVRELPTGQTQLFIGLLRLPDDDGQTLFYQGLVDQAQCGDVQPVAGLKVHLDTGAVVVDCHVAGVDGSRCQGEVLLWG